MIALPKFHQLVQNAEMVGATNSQFVEIVVLKVTRENSRVGRKQLKIVEMFFMQYISLKTFLFTNTRSSSNHNAVSMCKQLNLVKNLFFLGILFYYCKPVGVSTLNCIRAMNSLLGKRSSKA